MLFNGFELIVIYIMVYSNNTIMDNILDFSLCFFLIKGRLGVSAGAHNSMEINDIPKIIYPM